MADAELIEQLRAQVQSLRSPRSQHRAEAGSNNSGESGGRRPPYVGVTSSGGMRSRASSRLANATIDTEAPIILNVGGHTYTTSAGTLKAVESSYFSLMLNGVWEPSRTDEGHIFIDRNGKLFDYVLEYMRDQAHRFLGDFQLPEDVSTLKALRREAEFYQLPVLIARINKVLQALTIGESDIEALTLEDSDLYGKENYGKDHYSKERYNKEHSMKNRYDQEARADMHQIGDSVTEFDVAYSTVTSYYPTFPEEKIQELVSRINSSLSRKFDNGFRIKDVNSGLVLDHAQQPPYAMYLQVVLTRDRKPGQPPMQHFDKPRPMIPSSSAFVTAPPMRVPNQYPPPHPYPSEYHYSTSGRSTQDAVDHCSSEGEARYHDNRRVLSPTPTPHRRRAAQMVVSDQYQGGAGALGSPIDQSVVDPNFSIVPQGYHDKVHGPSNRGQHHGNGRGFDGNSEVYEQGTQYNDHRLGGNGVEPGPISPRDPYPYANAKPVTQVDRSGRESPGQRVVSSNIPRLNLAVIGGAPGQEDVRMTHEINGRPPSVQEIARRVEGWGNNHPNLMGGIPIPSRVSSPHPEFD